MVLTYQEQAVIADMKKIGYEDLMKRGLTLEEAAILLEAIYSCAIEGAEMPKSEKDLDHLCNLVKNERKKNDKHVCR